MKVVGSISYTKTTPIGVGQGMNSQVFLANDEQLGGVVVVKEIPKGSFGNGIQDFFLEAQALFASAHRNVVPVHYAGETPTHVFIAMPYCQKKSLSDRLTGGPLKVGEVLRIAHGVLFGLAHIHQKNLIHFDLKPSNVLFDAQDEAMVADFGQARKVTQGGIVAVSKMYWPGMPPEILASGVGGVQADIYQIGLLLYRALNGAPHYDEQFQAIAAGNPRQAILSGSFPDRKSFFPHVPRRLRTLIRKALSLDPAKRHQSASEFSDELGRVRIRYDWAATISPTKEITWECARKNSPKLIAKLVAMAKGRWAVEFYSQRSGSRPRGFQKKLLWRDNLTRLQALQHLKDSFQALEQG